MKHSIYGIELDFEPINTLAYQDSKFYTMMESTTFISFGNYIGRVKLVVDDDSNVLVEQMPMFGMVGFDIYTIDEIYKLREAINNYDHAW